MSCGNVTYQLCFSEINVVHYKLVVNEPTFAVFMRFGVCGGLISKQIQKCVPVIKNYIPRGTATNFSFNQKKIYSPDNINYFSHDKRAEL